MTYRAPKAIADHPAVEECVSGPAGGSDRRHDVFLKAGYRFTHLSPYDSDWTRQGFFDSAAEFKNEEIVAI